MREEDCGKAQRIVGDHRGLWEKGSTVKSMRNCGRTWRIMGKHRGLEGKQEDFGKTWWIMGEHRG